MEYFLQALRKYAVFTGRARRKEYWMFVLFQVLIGIAAAIVDGILGTGFEYGSGMVSALVTLGLFLPGLALGVRRLHDVNKSGWFWLIVFIPLVGAIWLLVLACTEGTQGPNQYGPDPKGSAVAV
ncbi:DUF805 domain-containing protein [Hymenobacter cellulosilyticus]|uniref:DUF805 domain-containing protein n=1 Tax=Hymenobacter cellulosilyticus TaxID=2932248 RepID=A0A8T9Q8W3_9BACT|nr:DUF805 domain-containing protein [Hymenobacter cellulosilyticus]UOQ72851.1 DUF805 domain-containing protein [Hymenobacter cellulosilyticus]